jgi:hypothetical protein
MKIIVSVILVGAMSSVALSAPPGFKPKGKAKRYRAPALPDFIIVSVECGKRNKKNSFYLYFKVKNIGADMPNEFHALWNDRIQAQIIGGTGKTKYYGFDLKAPLYKAGGVAKYKSQGALDFDNFQQARVVINPDQSDQPYQLSANTIKERNYSNNSSKVVTCARSKGLTKPPKLFKKKSGSR